MKNTLYLFLMSSIFVFGQTTKKTSELNIFETPKDIFKKYHKWGFVFGADVMYATNQKNGINYHIPTQRAMNIGVKYDFYQKNNFNFNASFIWRRYNVKDSEKFKPNSFNSVGDSPDASSQFKFPLYAEYYLPISKKINAVFGIGPEIILYPDDWMRTGSLAYLDDGTVVEYTTLSNSGSSAFFFGANAKFGLSIDTGGLLLQPFVAYHIQPETLYTTIVTTEDLPQNTISKHTITGEYLMFGIVINFKKRAKVE